MSLMPLLHGKASIMILEYKPQNTVETVLLLCIMQLLYTLWDRTCSILHSKDHDTFDLLKLLTLKKEGRLHFPLSAIVFEILISKKNAV